MADQDPKSPVYRQTEVVTDPNAENAVQVPRGNNDASNPGANVLTEPTPNEVFGDEVEPDPSEPEVPAPHDQPGVKPETDPDAIVDPDADENPQE